MINAPSGQELSMAKAKQRRQVTKTTLVKVAKKKAGKVQYAWAGVIGAGPTRRVDTWPGMEFGGVNPTTCMAIFPTRAEAQMRYQEVMRVEIREAAKGAKRGK